MVILAFSSERITVSEALNRLDVKQLVELTKFLKLDNKIGIKNDDMKKSIEDFSRTKSYFVETSNSKLVLDR
jgi:hypothetical protein